MPLTEHNCPSRRCAEIAGTHRVSPAQKSYLWSTTFELLQYSVDCIFPIVIEWQFSRVGTPDNLLSFQRNEGRWGFFEVVVRHDEIEFVTPVEQSLSVICE